MSALTHFPVCRIHLTPVVCCKTCFWQTCKLIPNLAQFGVKTTSLTSLLKIGKVTRFHFSFVTEDHVTCEQAEEFITGADLNVTLKFLISRVFTNEDHSQYLTALSFFFLS